MFGYVKILWPLMTGICLYAGCMHLQIGLRRPVDRTHTLFGVLSLCIAMGIFGRAWGFTAVTSAQYLQGAWIASTGAMLFYAFFPWFVCAYARLSQRWLATALSAFFVTTLIGSWLQPYSMVLSGPPVLEVITLPWGEQITGTATAGPPWALLQPFGETLLIIFTLLACIQTFRRGPRIRAWGLALSAGPFAVCQVINVLSELGIHNFGFVMAPGFMVTVVVMSLALTREWRRDAQQMQAVLDNVPAAVYLKRSDGRYLFVNRQFEVLYGLPVSAMIGKTDQQITGLERAPTAAQDDIEALTHNSLQSEEAIERDGESLTYAVSRTVLHDGDGSIYALCGIATDVTERNRAEERIRQLNRSYAALSDINQLIVYERDPQIILDRACRIAVDIGGFLRASISLVDAISGRLLVQAHAGVKADTLLEAGSGEPPPPCEFSLNVAATRVPAVCNDVERDPLAADWRDAALQCGIRAIASFPLVSDDECIGTFNLYANRVDLFDAEELRLLTELARDIAFAIEMRKREHERQLLEQQLAQSQKMEAIGQLAGGIAHDFNNILSAIVGNTELVRLDLSPDHPALTSIKEILSAGQRAKELVQRILAFSRPQPQQLRPILLQPVLDEAIRLLRATLPAGVELLFDAERWSPTVRADASQIHQIVLNLVTNAWHAMEHDIGRIAVHLKACRVDESLCSTHPELQPGPHVCLSVADSGKGMDTPTLSRIFEPFFTTKQAGQGAGLGLSVVHGIVRSHGGAIVVHSEPGKGTTFQVYFPAIEAEAAAICRDAPAVPSIMGRGECILYVDDEEPLVYLATRFLQRFGFRVEGYSSALNAVNAFRADPQRYDLVITDYNMPGMSGMDVARQVLQVRPDAPIVLASGYLRPNEIDQARALGIREVVFKPNTLEELGPLVQRLLSTLAN
jgi:PAS domain S-box-containing protein